MFTDTEIEEIVELLLTCSDKAKIYIGCDSKRFRKNKKWWGRYATVCIVHDNPNRVSRIFRVIQSEPDYDKADNMKTYRPRMRMMNEVQKTCEMYTQLIPFIEGFDIEIHLDISKDPRYKSSVAATEAAGYVLGMTGREPKLKPDSFAASFGADSIVNGRNVKDTVQ